MQKIQLRNKTFEQITYYKTGSGPSLLLVHGFPANWQLWREIIPALAKEYTIILPNFFEEKGDWLSGKETSMSLLADAFNDILLHEKINKTLFAGHSMGGYMGLAFAARYPEKLIGLSLIHSSPVPDDEARAEGRKKTVAILEKGGKSPFLKKMVRALFSEEFNIAKLETIERQTAEAIAVSDDSLIAFYKAIMDRKDTRDVVQKVKFPTQTIIGKKDSLANVSKELSIENLSNRNFVRIYHDSAHMAMLEEPEKMLKDLNHFFRYCLHSV